MKTQFRPNQVVYHLRQHNQWSKYTVRVMAIVWTSKGIFCDIELPNSEILRVKEKQLMAVKGGFKVIKGGLYRG